MEADWDFRRCLQSVLHIAERAIPVLAEPWEDSPAESPPFRAEKFVCETALLLYAASAAAEDSILRDRVRCVGQSLSRHARSCEIATAMRIRPALAAELSVAHVCLGEIGIPDAGFDETIRAAISGGFPTPERAQWKELEADWLARHSGLFPRPSRLAWSTSRTAFATGLDVLSAPRDELYAFTHAMIYLCDFGRESVDSPRPLDDILAESGCSLARCLDDDDFDLCAELLLAWPYFRVPLGSSATFALSILYGLESEIGFLPCPTIRMAEINKLPPLERRRTLFDRAYHTTYAMGLLAAAMLGANVEIARTPDPRGTRGIARKLHGLLLPKNPAPQWERQFDRLGAAAQDSLAEMIATIALRRALLGHDMRTFATILKLCAKHGLCGLPAVSQGAALLCRFMPGDQTVPRPAASPLAA